MESCKGITKGKSVCVFIHILPRRGNSISLYTRSDLGVPSNLIGSWISKPNQGIPDRQLVLLPAFNEAISSHGIISFANSSFNFNFELILIARICFGSFRLLIKIVDLNGVKSAFYSFQSHARSGRKHK